jgi:NhaA family Na+:H+ antiporter
MALHPWVAFGIMPLFAFANAGVNISGIDLTLAESQRVMFGVIAGLVVGKPLGVIAASWMAVQSRWCRLPPGVTWYGLCLVGLLAGIGFTMSTFIATLGFGEERLLDAAKAGVVLSSLAAGLLGLGWGRVHAKQL